MHHRSGSWVKGHYRNGTWVAGHNRKSTYVSDYTRLYQSKFTHYIPKNHIKLQNHTTESQADQKIKEAEKENILDLVFRIYRINDRTVGYTIDCDLGHRTDIKKLYEINLSRSKMKELLLRIDKRWNHRVRTDIPELYNQTMDYQHWKSLIKLLEDISLGNREMGHGLLKKIWRNFVQ